MSSGVDRIFEWCVLDFQPARGGVEEWEGLECCGLDLSKVGLEEWVELDLCTLDLSMGGVEEWVGLDLCTLDLPMGGVEDWVGLEWACPETSTAWVWVGPECCVTMGV